MGYAALGHVREEWLTAMRKYYLQFVTPLTSLYTLGEKLGLVSPQLIYDKYYY